jgi:hypothetical protein
MLRDGGLRELGLVPLVVVADNSNSNSELTQLKQHGMNNAE